MSTKRGMSIGIDRVGNEFFLNLKAVGTLSHEDYEAFTPMIDSALNSVKEPKVKAFFDITELQGWELRAAWDDFKLGLKHGNEFEKIALYGNKNWQEKISKVASWFVAGEVKFFDNYDEAYEWIKA
ncbi:MAG: STAS/SEC14 domain-containing protein [Campylobacterota bacterium]|nr:STAS/SEC14 domain-containing protein [Campylobacterota bacterium]